MSSFQFHVGGTAEDAIREYLEQNSLNSGMEILNLSLLLIMGGHYREAMGYAIQVEPASSSPPVLPETVDRDTARAAHIAAAERAKPLFEQAALEMEGNVEGGYVMTFYFEMLEGFRNGSGWNWAPDQDSTTSE